MSSSDFTDALGVAAVDDVCLASMVADLLEQPAIEIATAKVSTVPYDVPSITTAGRHWVAGTAHTPDGLVPWRIFVKHVRSWRHSPFFAHVPEEVREMAAASMPWRIEPLVYRSDLRDHLPAGLSMPRALGVFDLPQEAATMWLSEVEHPPVAWTPKRYERAAYLLGRLAGDSAVAERAGVGCFTWTIHDYVNGRLRFDVVPPLMGADAWEQPGVAEAFDSDLRARMRAGAERIEAHANELCELPTATSHGDASPNNLLPGARPDDFVLIDYGFFMTQPLGFDLGQLIAGETQLGRGPNDLAAVDTRCLEAYVSGLADEGVRVELDVVRRAHALHLFLMAGVSALPGREEMTPHQLAERASLARLSLDLLDATERS